MFVQSFRNLFTFAITEMIVSSLVRRTLRMILDFSRILLEDSTSHVPLLVIRVRLSELSAVLLKTHFTHTHRYKHQACKNSQHHFVQKYFFLSLFSSVFLSFTNHFSVTPKKTTPETPRHIETVTRQGRAGCTRAHTRRIHTFYECLSCSKAQSMRN